MNIFRIFRKDHLFGVIFSLCIIVIVVFPQLPCHGESNNYKRSEMTIMVKNVPLEDILKRISHDLGYDIIVNPPWGKIPLSLNLEGVLFKDGIRMIIHALGRPSHMIVTNDKDKRVSILISGLPSGYRNSGIELASSFDNKNVTTEMNKANLTSEFQMGFPSSFEIEVMKEEIKNHWKGLPKDTIIVPPSTSGGSGLTIGQLEAIKNEQKNEMKNLSGDAIIGPPPMLGGSRLTSNQLVIIKETLQKNQRTFTKDTIIGPPSISGGPGLTIGHLEAIKKDMIGNAKYDMQSKEISDLVGPENDIRE
ncbi:hypothetical protein ACFLZL_02050 [Thermodesulfobacteriota bacterium]